ncbi:fatty alcohol:caffeoyl-CoA acyltransferase [Solanum dulcamara]|uniref:fatty alcohol:caffeoyl-CoA acyltransferase n=1 Tax=Solanum dulcamara TaxID=45834 RepID=UPI002486C4B2|nr:fatty alcohol:caffeoyl-CoA acyltransferase [Solanum dulcamara]
MAPIVEELQFPQLEIPLIINSISPILPSSPIPPSYGDTLYLSNLDDMIGSRVFTPTMYFYRSNGKSNVMIINVLKEALANVLVPYYPFSGRLRETKDGKLEVFFGPNQGVLLVEACSEMTIVNLGDLTVPNPAWKNLVYTFPNEEQYKVIDMPLLIAQVTRFSCGGFSLGLRICHCLCDGVGAMQFLSAWASTARLNKLTINPKPCWDRETLIPHDPPLIQYPHIEFKRIDDASSVTRRLNLVKPVQKCYRVTREFQAHLKTLVGPNFSCTTFDAMAAHVWRSWVKALDVSPLDYELRLTFSVNCRSRLTNPPLKSGFYGNAVGVACATSNVSGIVNEPISNTICLVRNARLSVSEAYLRSTINYIQVNRPRKLEFGGKLTISQWTRFSMHKSADFGWGKPIYAGPIDLTPTPQVCLFLPQGGGDDDSDGTMLVCICLPEDASHRFTDIFCFLH